MEGSLLKESARVHGSFSAEGTIKKESKVTAEFYADEYLDKEGYN